MYIKCVRACICELCVFERIYFAYFVNSKHNTQSMAQLCVGQMAIFIYIQMLNGKRMNPYLMDVLKKRSILVGWMMGVFACICVWLL